MIAFKAKGLTEQTTALGQYLPNDRVFCAKNIENSNLRNLLKGLGGSFVDIDQLIEDLWQGVSLLNTTDPDYIAAWEGAVGIPDECFTGEGTIIERRDNIILKLRSLGVLTEEDFIALFDLLGITANILSGVEVGVFPYTFPFILFGSKKGARFTMIIQLPTELDPGVGFPYTFPITFGENQTFLQCLINQIKPSNVTVIFQYVL